MIDNALGLRIWKDRVVVSSRDVANAFEKRHDNVLRDISNLNCSAEFRLLNFEETSQSVAMPKGGMREDKFYLVTRDGFVILVMGYTGEKAMKFKEAYIREFNRMEKTLREKPAIAVPRTLKDALLLAARLEGEREALEAKNREMSPKAEFYDAVAKSSTAIDMGRAAKILNFIGIGRNNLLAFLRNTGILMPDNVPYQEYIDRGYFRLIERRYETPDGETHVNTKLMAYQAGIGFIMKKLTEAGYKRAEQYRQSALFADEDFTDESGV
ncbi:MAG: phage regulatory protein/antirepressor Ant [Synergistaceae bacterium]|nr:phage regulatory protein/antirepressor Ant [Synergistaceae bacterium]